MTSSCFGRLGINWTVNQTDNKELEHITLTLFEHTRVHTIDGIRLLMLQKMVGADNTLNVSSKVDLSKLSPCLISFAPHIHRVHYHLAQWKDQTQILLSAHPLRIKVVSQAKTTHRNLFGVMHLSSLQVSLTCLPPTM